MPQAANVQASAPQAAVVQTGAQQESDAQASPQQAAAALSAAQSPATQETSAQFGAPSGVQSAAPRISVIIPICNVEGFLDECLNSVQAQTLGSLEILCLNDGSSDGSSAIMHAHAAADARIVCVDKANEGYGATCNRGLDMARGEYIAIVEPDDYLLPGMFEEMLAFGNSLGGGIDVIKTPWYDLAEWDNPQTFKQKPSLLCGALPTSTAPFTVEAAPVLLETHPSIWSALYRREFLNNLSIRFNPYPGAGWADNPFLIDTLCQAKSIAYLDKPFYCYRTDLPGSTKNHGSDEKIALPLNRWLDMTERMKQLGVTDRGLWVAHTLRGFNYVNGAILDDGWDNPVVQAKTREVFALIPAEYVVDCKKLSVSKKRFYFEVTGQPEPKLSPLPYMGYLASRAAQAVRVQGVGFLLKDTLRFAGNKVNKQGMEQGQS